MSTVFIWSNGADLHGLNEQSHLVFQVEKTGVFLASLVMCIACSLVFNAHHFFPHTQQGKHGIYFLD